MSNQRVADLGETLRGSLWFIPGICMVGAVALSILTVWIDHQLAPRAEIPLLFDGSASGAQGFLSTIASAMLTFTGLVFTITMVVLQLASAQFSPRVLRTYLRDRQSQASLGVFVGTFTYALLVLRVIRAETDDVAAFVPNLSVSIAFALVVISIIVFIHYAHHIASSIRVVNVISSVARETRATASRIYPARAGTGYAAATWEPGDQPREVVGAPRPGVITTVDDDRIIRIASEADIVAELLHPVGRFVPDGSPLFRVYGESPEQETLDGLAGTVHIGPERSMQQDVAFGFRQLVDIAARALSPGVNDPTTASQALDQIHDLLRDLATREFPSPVRTGEDGKVRAVLPHPDWEDLLLLAVEEIRIYGEGSIQVARRLRRMLTDLEDVLPPLRREVVRDQIDALERTTLRGLEEPEDRSSAQRPEDRNSE